MQYSLTSVLYCAFKILIFRLLPNVNFTSREAGNSHSDRFGGRVGLEWPSEIPPLVSELWRGFRGLHC